MDPLSCRGRTVLHPVLYRQQVYHTCWRVSRWCCFPSRTLGQFRRYRLACWRLGFLSGSDHWAGRNRRQCYPHVHRTIFQLLGIPQWRKSLRSGNLCDHAAWYRNILPSSPGSVLRVPGLCKWRTCLLIGILFSVFPPCNGSDHSCWGRWWHWDSHTSNELHTLLQRHYVSPCYREPGSDQPSCHFPYDILWFSLFYFSCSGTIFSRYMVRTERSRRRRRKQMAWHSLCCKNHLHAVFRHWIPSWPYPDRNQFRICCYLYHISAVSSAKTSRFCADIWSDCILV